MGSGLTGTGFVSWTRDGEQHPRFERFDRRSAAAAIGHGIGSFRRAAVAWRQNGPSAILSHARGSGGRIRNPHGFRAPGAAAGFFTAVTGIAPRSSGSSLRPPGIGGTTTSRLGRRQQVVADPGLERIARRLVDHDAQSYVPASTSSTRNDPSASSLTV